MGETNKQNNPTIFKEKYLKQNHIKKLKIIIIKEKDKDSSGQCQYKHNFRVTDKVEFKTESTIYKKREHNLY